MDDNNQSKFLLLQFSHSDQPFWNAFVQGAIVAAKKSNIEFKVKKSSAPLTPETFSAFLAKAIAESPQVIAAQIPNFDTITPHLKEMESKSIQFISLTPQFVQDKTVFSVPIIATGIDAYHTAVKFTKWAFDTEKIHRRIVVVADQNHPLEQDPFYFGLKQKLTEKFIIIDRLIIKNGTFQSIDFKQYMNHNKFSCAIVLNGSIVSQIQDQLSTIKYQGSRFPYVFIPDNTPTHEQLLKDRKVDGIIDRHPFKLGYACVSQAHRSHIIKAHLLTHRTAEPKPLQHVDIKILEKTNV